MKPQAPFQPPDFCPRARRQPEVRNEDDHPVGGQRPDASATLFLVGILIFKTAFFTEHIRDGFRALVTHLRRNKEKD